MTKKEFFEQFWTKITVRLPPNDPLEIVLTYNASNGYISTWMSHQAHDHAEYTLRGKQEELSWDRHFTHWMPVYPPEGKKSHKEHVNSLGGKQKTKAGCVIHKPKRRS